MEIIDMHAHIYPESIASKAVVNISKFYSLDMDCEGTATALVESGKTIGVKKYVVHSAATVAHQVSHINAFILREAQKHPEFIPFGTLHPDLTQKEVENEIAFMLKNGFKGVKLHSDFQRFNIDSEEAIKLYSILDGVLPILFHVGDKRLDYSKPERLVKVCKMFKNHKFICAHLGGYTCWDRIDIYNDVIKYDNLFFDTSSSLMFLDKDVAAKIINKFGAEKFFWGSDFPMWRHDEELKRFLSLNLTDGQNEKILHKNAEDFLRIL